MPGIITTALGNITMTEDLVANIAGYAAMENYGIVGMNNKTAGDAILQLVGGDSRKRGVKVTFQSDGHEVDIDLFVTLIYGVSLPAVAQNTIANVRYRVSEYTGLSVHNVNIFVESVRV
ncbi:MAG: Asp23/Gls24 family envelope stress response protein [Clostridia bacterium]